MSNANIPVFLPGAPGVPGPRTTIDSGVPVYSLYTGNLVGHGPMPFGIPTDDPTGVAKTYHGIVNYGTYGMVHAPPPCFFGNGYGGFGW